LQERGVRGFIGFRRVFTIADTNGNGQLDFGEFKGVFQDYRLAASEEDLHALFCALDSNQSGSVDFNEFLRHLTGEVNEHRERFVHTAFCKLDKDGSGAVDAKDITGTYNASQHPDV
jgi:Ca2+-binding EF-hand superfamily protein